MTAAERNAQILSAQTLSFRLQQRVNANKCCAIVYPTGSNKSRFCRNDAVSRDPETGRTYCAQHPIED